jgi:hypothetical protein
MPNDIGLGTIILVVLLLFFALRGRREITDAKLGRVTVKNMPPKSEEQS